MRERYAELIANPAEVERILLAGAEKARAEAAPYTRELRAAVGLRSLAAMQDATAASADKAADKASAPPVFKQYREKDGRFYFKMTAANGDLLLQSKGYDNPREAAAAIAALKTQGPGALEAMRPQLEDHPQSMLETIRNALDVLLTLQE